jgi:ribosomal protein S18 acetylase RimI-like enzyme
MGIAALFSRFTAYYARHGFVATVRRTELAVKRAIFSNRMVVFYCDLAKQSTARVNLPSSLKVERLRSAAELRPQDLHEISSFWNSKLARRNIEERFKKSANLWLIKLGDRLAGYGWTIQGSTIEPYFFPLSKDDVHLFDYHIFPQFRGRGLNPLLLAHILQILAAEGICRAFIEAAEWNEAQLSSLRKTQFRSLGRVRKITLLGHSFVRWVDQESVGEVLSFTKGNNGSVGVARSHER